MKILIVDDHAIVRDGLSRLLATDGEHELKLVATGRDALIAARSFRPDLVILDLNLPGLGGLELLRQLVEAGHGRVLVLSMHAAPRFARRALAAGAYGYVSKNAQPEELITAVQRVNQGARYVDREIAQALALDPDGEPQTIDALSIREIEILRLLAQGSSLEQIGQELGVTYKTVANNCALIKSKLGVSRTVDLLRLALDIHAGADAGGAQLDG